MLITLRGKKKKCCLIFFFFFLVKCSAHYDRSWIALHANGFVGK